MGVWVRRCSSWWRLSKWLVIKSPPQSFKGHSQQKQLIRPFSTSHSIWGQLTHPSVPCACLLGSGLWFLPFLSSATSSQPRMKSGLLRKLSLDKGHLPVICQQRSGGNPFLILDLGLCVFSCIGNSTARAMVFPAGVSMKIYILAVPPSDIEQKDETGQSWGLSIKGNREVAGQRAGQNFYKGLLTNDQIFTSERTIALSHCSRSTNARNTWHLFGRWLAWSLWHASFP